MYTRFSNLFDVLLGTLAHAYNMLLAHTCSVGAKYQLRQALCMHDRLRINNFNLQCMYACILPTGTLRVCVCVCVCVCVLKLYALANTCGNSTACLAMLSRNPDAPPPPPPPPPPITHWCTCRKYSQLQKHILNFNTMKKSH